MSIASATPETVRVSPGRLASGRWCHQTDRQQGQGDISASYSADRIAMQGRVRAPFRLQGWLCVAVSLSRNGAEAYRLVPAGAFDGEPTTYAEKVRAADGERARNDPQGFHHGMRVTHGARLTSSAGHRFASSPVIPSRSKPTCSGKEARHELLAPIQHSGPSSTPEGDPAPSPEDGKPGALADQPALDREPRAVGIFVLPWQLRRIPHQGPPAVLRAEACPRPHDGQRHMP